MVLCKCKKPAEVEWTVNGPEEMRQIHTLCSNCMSSLWGDINKRYPDSYAQQSSTFSVLNQ